MALKNSGRRAFLRGAGGVALGLPLLEYTHCKAWAASGGKAKRVVMVLNHGGEAICIHKNGQRGGERYGTTIPNIDHWRPSGGKTFGVAHQVFEGTPIENKTIVMRGIDNRVCTSGRYGGDHSLSNASVLTARKTKCGGGGSPAGAKCQPDESQEYATGPSIDWVLAQRLQKQYGGRDRPYNLIVPGHYYGTGFYWGAGGEQRTRGEHDPRAAFDALFTGVMSGGGGGTTGGGTTGPDPAVVRGQKLHKSQLNSLMDSYRAFSKRLGANDKQIVDAHLDHISFLEREIQVQEAGMEMQAPPPNSCEVPSRHSGFSDWHKASANAQTIGPLHSELIVAAMRCGLTHVANLEITDFLTPWAPSGLQIDSAHGIGHALGHWVDSLSSPSLVSKWELEMKENRAWRMGLVKKIADGLDAVSEGDGTMLDNSMIFYTNEFSTGGIHSSTDGPYMIIGSAGGYFKTGQYVELPRSQGYATNNVYTTLLNAIGENDSGFGDMSLAPQSGGIPGVTA